MEFSAGINFSSNPMENKELTITYSGYLFENNSSELTIVYGFGDNWMYTNEQKMEKTENGFVTNIKMLNFSTFSFCFKNENNIWDNNYNCNFTSPISEFKVDEEAFVLNENEVEEIVTNLVKYDVSESVDNIQTINEDNSFEVFIEKTENIDISETIVNVTLENELNDDLNQEFSEYYENEENNEITPSIEAVETDTQKFDVNEFAELFEDVEKAETSNNEVDNVVSDMIDNLYENSRNVENTSSGFEPSHFSMDISKIYRYGEQTGLVVSPRSLGAFYSFKKRMKVAVYKFFSIIPKLLGRTYDEDI